MKVVVKNYHDLRRPFFLSLDGVASAVSTLLEFAVCSDRVLHGLRLENISIYCRLSLP